MQRTWFVYFFYLLSYCATADVNIWVICASHRSKQGKLASKKARPSGPPGGASLLVNRNAVRPRCAGLNVDAPSQIMTMTIDERHGRRHPPTPDTFDAPAMNRALGGGWWTAKDRQPTS